MSNANVPHIIRGNKSGAAPQTWVVVDTETTPVQLSQNKWQHSFRLGVVAIWRRSRSSKRDSVEFRRYLSADDLVRDIAELPKSKERVGVVAHNLDFDALVLDIAPRLRSAGYHLTRAVLERGKWVQQWRKGGVGTNESTRTLLWLDLGNFFPIPLRQIAFMVGEKKFRLPRWDESNSVWLQRCEQDVSITLKALQSWLIFLEEHDLGYFAPTIAGQSFNAFRHRFMSHQIYVHTHPDVIALERASYIGGRNQEFWRGNAPRHDYVHLDFTSMYGAVMLGNRYPTKQVAHYGRVTPLRLASLLQNQLAIAHVRIDQDAPVFPKRAHPRVIYPLGHFETVLATPELLLAIEYGYLRDVLEVVTYEGAPLFSDYVRYFWKLRQQALKDGDEFSSKLAKRFLTSVHGKFGQRIFTSELIGTGFDREDEIWAEYDMEDGRWYEYRSLAGRLERRSREVNARDTLVAIPAHVASYARVKLWRTMAEAGLDNIMYVDTDSLIVRREAMARIGHHIKPHTLGGLRIINQSRILYIRAPKWYRFGREVKRAGVSGNARPVTWDKFEQDYFHSMRWSLSHQYAGAAIVEQVEINAPYKNLLTEHGVGHPIPHPYISEDT